MDVLSGEADAVRLGIGGTAQDRPDTSMPPPATIRVLCVDDFRDSADTLGALLRIYGCEVRVCYDGATALALDESFRPDVCVLDLTMPGMNGDELAKAIRARRSPAPRLVAVTALGDETARGRTAAAGFDFHLVKPVEPDELANVVADVVIMQGWTPPPAP
jgi:two-component system, OmpR family, response regulator